MPFTEAALAAELDNDPKALGYEVMVDSNGNHDVGLVTEALNTPGRSGETLIADRVETETIAGAIVRTEWNSLPADAKTFLADVVLSGPWVRTGSATMRANLAALFPAGSQTRDAMIALASRPAARAEILFGADGLVTAGQVEEAFYDLGWWSRG
jgi:hypothetical protein